MHKNYIGWDNGVTGALALLREDGRADWYKMPVKYELSFQKEEQHIHRVDIKQLRKILSNWNLAITDTIITIERPLFNPMRWKASISAARCLEATLIIIEEFGFNLEFIDSRVWQKILLPNINGSSELKKASAALGKKLYPNIKFKSDADALLIAYYAKNKETLQIKPLKLKKQL
jgi:hypothetical protein